MRGHQIMSSLSLGLKEICRLLFFGTLLTKPGIPKVDYDAIKNARPTKRPSTVKIVYDVFGKVGWKNKRCHEKN